VLSKHFLLQSRADVAATSSPKAQIMPGRAPMRAVERTSLPRRPTSLTLTGELARECWLLFACQGFCWYPLHLACCARSHTFKQGGYLQTGRLANSTPHGCLALPAASSIVARLPAKHFLALTAVDCARVQDPGAAVLASRLWTPPAVRPATAQPQPGARRGARGWTIAAPDLQVCCAVAAQVGVLCCTELCVFAGRPAC